MMGARPSYYHPLDRLHKPPWYLTRYRDGNSVLEAVVEALPRYSRLHVSVAPDRREPGARFHNARSVQPSRPSVTMAPVWRPARGRMCVSRQRGDFPISLVPSSATSMPRRLGSPPRDLPNSTRRKRLRGFSLAAQKLKIPPTQRASSFVALDYASWQSDTPVTRPTISTMQRLV
jgi:hypothetical protein